MWDAAEPALSMKRIRILIVDEHQAVRQALAARLASYADIEVIATARNFREGLDRAASLHPDVVLLELKGRYGWQPDPVGTMCRALAGFPAGVIVLTSYPDDDERESAIHAGARRYLLKQIDSAQLHDEIAAVALETA
jgi:NarL family two-component system response regulator LiaR